MSNILFQVNKFDNEKTALQKDVASITSKLVDAKVTICDLEEESVSPLTIIVLNIFSESIQMAISVLINAVLCFLLMCFLDSVIVERK